jgi:predicted ATP-dependent serine protease
MSKLNTILAIAEKYLNINLRSRDVYVQISGLAKNLTDDSLDLSILLAIISSVNNKLVGDIIVCGVKKPIFAGRLTLSGQLRNPTSDKERSKTATSLGFDYNPSIRFEEISKVLK